MSTPVTGPRETVLPDPQIGPGGPIMVLIVDMDGVARRFIELALERDRSFQVESALDGAGALEILAHTKVDAIIAESELIDMDGLELYRRLTTENRLRDIPFLFLSSDRRTATRIVAFQEGVDEFMVKPCDMGELVARLKSAVARRRRALAAARSRGYMLAGRLAALAFPDLVTIIEQARRSGTLAVAAERALGTVHFDGGRVVHVSFGNLIGEDAFQALMELEDAQFEFSQEPCQVPESQRSIHTSATGLILEAARRIDTRKHESTRRPAPTDTRKRPPPTTGAIRVRPAPLAVPALIPSGIAAQFRHAIGDGYALGDLCLYTRTSLTEWLAADRWRHRFHVHLLADARDAVPAFLGLAGAPSERWVATSLSSESKVLGLTFSLRHELMLDVIHLDIANPRGFQGSLRRAPSLLLVAPPGGDFLEMGTKARVELEQLVARAVPTAVLGVGDQALEPALRSLPALREHGRLRAAPGALGLGGVDLRSLLVDGIRLCTAEEKS